MTLTSLDKTHIRSGATRMVLEKTNRILGQPDNRVLLNDAGIPAPAYTDGMVITINAGMEPVSSALQNGFTPKTVMLTTALNYHELAHCMFTPRLNSKLAKKVQSKGAFMSFNILEDQAAETRFVTLYEPSRHYFTSLVTNYMMRDRNYLAANYPLVGGRLFLPQTFRDKFRNYFSKPELIPDIDRLVAEYKTLVWPDHEDRMYEIIVEFDDLLKEVNHSQPGTPHDQLQRGRPDPRTSRRVAAEKEYVNTEPEEEDESEEPSEGVSEESGEDEKGQGKSKTSNDDPGSSESDEEEGEGEGTQEGGSAPETEGSGGSSKPLSEPEEPPAPPSKREMKDLLDETMKGVLDEVEHELEERIDAIREQERDYQVEDEEEHFSHQTVSTEQVALVNNCVEEFRQAQVQQLPGWHRHQRSGKLDHRRYAKALQGGDDVFRRWREGVNDAFDFEVVFLVDQSGSMYDKMNEASVALWVLQRTFEECDGTVTVLGFCDYLSLLTQRGTKASRTHLRLYRHHGSTLVDSALREARRILSTSRRTIKLCVVISDGGFHDHGAAEHTVKQMDMPVVMVGINTSVQKWEGVPNVLHQQTIRKPTELVDVVKNVALQLSNNHIERKSVT